MGFQGINNGGFCHVGFIIGAQNISLHPWSKFPFIALWHLAHKRFVEGRGIIDFFLKFNVIRSDNNVLYNDRAITLEYGVSRQFVFINFASFDAINLDLMILRLGFPLFFENWNLPLLFRGNVLSFRLRPNVGLSLLAFKTIIFVSEVLILNS